MTEIQNEGKFLQESKGIIKSIVKDEEIREVIYGIIDLVFFPVTLPVKGISYIRDMFFVRKLEKFLYEFKNLSGEEIEKFCIDLETNPKYTRDVGEHIILLLDNADQDRKATLLGKTFRAYIEEYIDVEDLQRISSAINKLLICDLEKLEPFSRIDEEISSGSSESINRIFRFLESNEDVAQSFLNAGLGNVNAGWGLQGTILPNKTCKLFVKYVLKNVEK